MQRLGYTKIVLTFTILAFIFSSCSWVNYCPTYSGSGNAIDMRKMKVRSLARMEKRFFKNYARHHGRMIVVNRR